jgi:hypothetical protein
MTREEAAAAVESGLADLVAKRIRVRLPNHIATIKPSEAGLTIDPVASVAPAFGRTLNPLALLGGVAGSNDFPAVTKVDEAALEKQIAVVADNLDTPAQNPSIDIKGTRVSLTPARPGTAVDRKATAAAVVSARGEFWRVMESAFPGAVASVPLPASCLREMESMRFKMDLEQQTGGAVLTVERGRSCAREANDVEKRDVHPA